MTACRRCGALLELPFEFSGVSSVAVVDTAVLAE